MQEMVFAKGLLDRERSFSKGHWNDFFGEKSFTERLGDTKMGNK